jgi:hypothetical protein
MLENLPEFYCHGTTKTVRVKWRVPSLDKCSFLINCQRGPTHPVQAEFQIHNPGKTRQTKRRLPALGSRRVAPTISNESSIPLNKLL